MLRTSLTGLLALLTGLSLGLACSSGDEGSPGDAGSKGDFGVVGDLGASADTPAPADVTLDLNTDVTLDLNTDVTQPSQCELNCAFILTCVDGLGADSPDYEDCLTDCQADEALADSMSACISTGETCGGYQACMEPVAGVTECEANCRFIMDCLGFPIGSPEEEVCFGLCGQDEEHAGTIATCIESESACDGVTDCIAGVGKCFGNCKFTLACAGSPSEGAASESCLAACKLAHAHALKVAECIEAEKTCEAVAPCIEAL